MKLFFTLMGAIMLMGAVSAQVTDSSKTTLGSDSMHTNMTTDTMHMAGDTSHVMNGNANGTMGNMPAMDKSSMSNTGSMNGKDTAGILNPMNIQGKAGYASLPITENFVPGDAVSKIKDKYTAGGMILYDITTVTTARAQTDSIMAPDSSMKAPTPAKNAYVVRTIKNNKVSTTYLDSDNFSEMAPPEMKEQ